MKNKKACVYFHQGWTDIIMCMGLINYYKSLYVEIYVIIRSDAKELVDYYIRNTTGINIIYINTDNGRFYGNIDTEANIDTVDYVGNTIRISKDLDIMFHAEHDRYRRDRYRGYWYQLNNDLGKHFSELFYVFYDIDFINRINYFSLDRDLNLEEERYQEFINKNGEEYVIYHDDESNHQHGSHHVSTKINFETIIEGCTYVNVNKQTNVFFDYIKIFQEAKEIHLVDSIWACLLYQLDAKYGIFNGKKINVYCKRGHHALFQYPIKLDNWIIK